MVLHAVIVTISYKVDHLLRSPQVTIRQGSPRTPESPPFRTCVKSFLNPDNFKRNVLDFNDDTTGESNQRLPIEDSKFGVVGS